MPDLLQAITLYLPPDTDRDEVARLIKAMCSLNGVTVAIEIHAAQVDGSVRSGPDELNRTSEPGA